MKKSITLLALLTSLNAAATSTDWSVETNSATVTEGDNRLVVQMSLSSEGRQNLYMNYHNPEWALKRCEKRGEKTAEHTVINVNGVNVKTLLYCRLEETDLWYTDTWYAVEVALSDEGKQYVLKQFKESATVVIDGYSVSTKGFTEVLASVGEDAI